MSTIDHITLDTGHRRASPRSEVRDDTVALMRTSLEAALERPRDRIPVPMISGFTYGVTAEGGTLMVTIFGTVENEPAPIVTFGVAPKGSDAAGLWSVLHGPRGGLEQQPYATRASKRPATPWLAARMELGAALMTRDDLLWLADFERVVAWTWMEMRRVD